MRPRARTRSWAAATCALLLTSCESHLFVESTWPASDWVVLVATGAAGELLWASPHLHAPGEVVSFELRAGDPVRFLIRTFLPPGAGGPDLAACGVTFGGPGATLPAPHSAYRTELLELGEVERATAELDTEPRDLDLRFERCLLPRFPCEELGVERLDTAGAAGTTLLSVAATDDEAALVLAARDTTGPTWLGRIDARRVSLLEELRYATRGRDLARDGDGRVHAVTEQEHLVLSATGQLRAVHALTDKASGLAAGEDGTLAAFGDDGVELLTEGALTQSPLGARLGPVSALAIASASRAVAITDPDFFFFDGTSWSSEHTSRASAFEKWDAVAGDASQFVGVDRNGLVIRRDEATRSWMNHPRPFPEGPRWRDVAVLSGGRLVVVGDAGNVAVWTGDGWCTALPTGTLASLRAVSVAPSRRVAFAVGDRLPDAASDTPAAFRLTLP